MNEIKQSRNENLSADLIVVGGGGAGYAAAAMAAENGASVIILEKRRAVGGSSLIPEGIAAAESQVNKRLQLVAFKDDIFRLAMDYSHWSINSRLTRAWINRSADTIHWLEEKGIIFQQIPAIFPGHDRFTCHSMGRGGHTGKMVIDTLSKQCKKQGVKLFVNAPAKKILLGKKGEVTGVRAVIEGKETDITAKNVMIATGGFSSNKKLLKKYVPSYDEHIAFLAPPSSGDGLLMALEAGAATDSLGVLHLHPQYYRHSPLVSALIQEPWPVWLNKKGERYCDESLTMRPVEVSMALNRQPDKCVIVVFDDATLDLIMEQGLIRGNVHGKGAPVNVPLPKLRQLLEEQVATGEVRISESLDDIADWMGTPRDVVKTSVADFNSSCIQGLDELFLKDRRYLRPVNRPPYYAVRGYLSCLGTNGGCRVNEHLQVLDKNDDPIPGLYAGGNMAGGWTSDTYCMYIPGNAFGFAVNSGRIAGEHAARRSR